MKYKEGDKVRIKSKEWYNNNKDKYGNVHLTGEYVWMFTERDSRFCDKVVTIFFKGTTSYAIVEDNCEGFWTDEMIEGLVEEETPKFKIGDKITNGKTHLTILKITSDKYLVEDNLGECGILYFNTQDDWKLMENGTKFGTASNPIESKSNANCLTRERVDELATKIDKELPSGNQNVWELPDGYQFTDENGNIINTTKIVLEKKKKEYPKTYVKCLVELIRDNPEYGYDEKYPSLETFRELLICRDAYWKIAGEEIGLDKPWEPDWKDENQVKYIIGSWLGTIQCLEENFISHPLTFPTEEMRDAFYENFKELIEQCKELL